jgi:glucan phosphoethanolaminetransferase (alkaline phosphatase superfamily)
MKKFIHIVFEKYGMLKMFGSAILSFLFYTLYYYTGLIIFKYLIIPFGIFFGLLALLLFIYAYIINPMNDRKSEKTIK